ncbi:helix-turn-helix transcriptional regulator [Saccharothrix sp. S26]|uniref:helix-turn-helix domain-containing protein n=1 Tax=Saccharothrix sp. S26 TaxID=2907215 RepID=UPI001F2EF721|nr:helix-turn-helix transcriptional regulator [Saccharothrix sp. S26]MCE6998378.1 helix-turn-helix transcriptional regulator [Saccharothrix sp. S26]
MSNEVHYPGSDAPSVSVLPFRPRSAGREVFTALPFEPGLPGDRTTWRTLLDRVDLLSVREREVLLLLGAGASNRTIASRLNVAERTVKAHVAQVMAKLVVESRLQAGLVSLVFQWTCAGSTPVGSHIPGASPTGHGESA